MSAGAQVRRFLARVNATSRQDWGDSASPDMLPLYPIYAFPPPTTVGSVRAVSAENDELRDALAVAMELLDRLAEVDGHEGHGPPCPHPLARQLVAAWRRVELERAEVAAAIDDDLDERDGAEC